MAKHWLHSLIFSGVVMVIPITTLACSCGPGSMTKGFLDTYHPRFWVLHGKVLSHTQYAENKPLIIKVIQVEVKNSFNNTGLPLKTITVIDGWPGSTCDHNIQRFPVGSEWVFQLWQGEEGLPGQPFRLSTSGCGVYWLAVENDQVRGMIFGRSDEMTIPISTFEGLMSYRNSVDLQRLHGN